MRKGKKANGEGLSREAIFQHLIESYNTDYRPDPVGKDEFTSLEFGEGKNIPGTTKRRMLDRLVANGMLECRLAYSTTLHRKVRAYRYIAGGEA